ncbi:MAG: hypothetical protein LBK47_00515 [Prevotellaceae bacterium]|jgi:hypothetical protein|nr:hypothetical protein [Prevotellaceae bacterium]
MLTSRSKVVLGTLVGLVVPVITFFIFYRTSYAHTSFESYVRLLMFRSMISKVLAITALPNLLVFYLFLWLNKDLIARGVVVGTIMVALVVAVLYFVY